VNPLWLAPVVPVSLAVGAALGVWASRRVPRLNADLREVLREEVERESRRRYIAALAALSSMPHPPQYDFDSVLWGGGKVLQIARYRALGKPGKTD
jgi:hypothetical protein